MFVQNHTGEALCHSVFSFEQLYHFIRVISSDDTNKNTRTQRNSATMSPLNINVITVLFFFFNESTDF